MRVLVQTVGSPDSDREIKWPPGWPLPRQGESFAIKDLPTAQFVRVVEWFPYGEEDDLDPFVLVVVGPKPPHS